MNDQERTKYKITLHHPDTGEKKDVMVYAYNEREAAIRAQYGNLRWAAIRAEAMDAVSTQPPHYMTGGEIKRELSDLKVQLFDRPGNSQIQNRIAALQAELKSPARAGGLGQGPKDNRGRDQIRSGTRVKIVNLSPAAKRYLQSQGFTRMEGTVVSESGNGYYVQLGGGSPEFFQSNEVRPA